MAKMEILKRPVEQIGANIKQNAWSSIFESLATIVIGILFVAWPEVMVTTVAYIIGAIFSIKGAYQIINYFLEKGQNDFFNNNLLSGVVSVLIGIAAFVVGGDIANVFRIIVGIFIIYEALSHLNLSLKLYSAQIGIWKYVLILALTMLVLGLFVTFNDVAAVIGWVLVATGIVSIVGDILFIQQINNFVEKLTQ